MKFEFELARLTKQYIEHLHETQGSFVANLAEMVLGAFLKWYVDEV